MFTRAAYEPPPTAPAQESNALATAPPGPDRAAPHACCPRSFADTRDGWRTSSEASRDRCWIAARQIELFNKRHVSPRTALEGMPTAPRHSAGRYRDSF